MAELTRVTYETRVEGRIAIVSMARPRHRNPLSQQMMEELVTAFQQAEKDSSVRVIVLRGLGPTFSAGHDLGSPDAMPQEEYRAQAMPARYRRMRAMDLEPHLYMRNIPKPTIAMVHGHCIYASWMLASAMDVVFAASDSVFLATNFAYFSVPWDLGVRRAKHLLYEGKSIDAYTAREYGFVQEVFEPDVLERETLAYAERVAENDPFQLELMKNSINAMQDVQGFASHINGAFADRIVRAANTDVQVTAEPDAPGGRRRYLNVERALNRTEERDG